MRLTHISQGGQVQIPAEVRRRWGTRKVMIDDAGTYLRISPVPDDPIAAAAGSLAGLGSGISVNESLRIFREEEAEAEERKWKHLGKRR
jgi:bifunctional DNA-binding transcriptional regulator/antitoxin component of YhaV-PrlF toxin-antitoxin module